MNHAAVYADVTAVVSIGGDEERIEAMTLSDLRRDIIMRAAAHAESTGSPIELTIEDIDAVATLRVHPGGKVEETEPRQPRTSASGSAPAVSDARPTSQAPSGVAPINSVPRAADFAGRQGATQDSATPDATGSVATGSDATGSAAAAVTDTTGESPVRPASPSASVPADTLAPDSAAYPRVEAPAAESGPDTASRAWAAAPTAPPASAPSASRGQSAPYTPGSISSAPAPVSGANRAKPAASATPQAKPQAEPGRPTQEPRQSFLVQETVEEPASRGFRGALSRMGMRVPPSAAERAERADEQAVSQHWPGPRTIAVVNGKGGAGKTPTTILLSAVLARYGGAGVLAWDNNQTRGTLGWRTEQGPHDATLHDLLPNVDRLLGTGAQSADLASFVHHQTRDRFDVLRSKPMALASAQRVSGEDVDAIHAVASKYYRLVVIDSGNDESDPLWLRMIDHTDQIVVATTTRDDHAEAGALLLDALRERDERSARLAAGAVAVVTQADPKESKHELQRVADGYRKFAREVVPIPHDPAMVDGLLRLGSLDSATQRAWLAAGAAVARGL